MLLLMRAANILKTVAILSIGLAMLLLIGCSKEDPVEVTGEAVVVDGDLMFVPPGSDPNACIITETLSDWTIQLPINGSGSEKLVINNTDALRTMAYTGNTSALRNEYRCRYDVRSVNVLRTGHESDINNIGFAGQLQIEDWIFAMYHPNNFPDHFIVYNVNTQEWFRYDHSDESIYLQS